MYSLYVLKSQSRERTYIGITQDVEKRLRQHNRGFVQSTKAYRPYIVVHTEIFSSMREARQEELKLKHHSATKEALFKQIGIS